MATINMCDPSLDGGYLQTKVFILMNLGSDMVNLDLVLTQDLSRIISQESHNLSSKYTIKLYIKTNQSELLKILLGGLWSSG